MKKNFELIWIIILFIIIMWCIWITEWIFIRWLTCDNKVKITTNNLNDWICNNVNTNNNDFVCYCMWWTYISDNKCYYKKYNPKSWWSYWEFIYEFNYIFK